MRPFFTDIRVFDVPRTRQNRRRGMFVAIVIMIYLIGGTVLPDSGRYVWNVAFNILALVTGLWIMVAPTRRTPDEQEQHDKQMDHDFPEWRAR